MWSRKCLTFLNKTMKYANNVNESTNQTSCRQRVNAYKRQSIDSWISPISNKHVFVIFSSWLPFQTTVSQWSPKRTCNDFLLQCADADPTQWVSSTICAALSLARLEMPSYPVDDVAAAHMRTANPFRLSIVYLYLPLRIDYHTRPHVVDSVC